MTALDKAIKAAGSARKLSMFGLHRTTAEKYIRIAIQQGELIRHGRSGIFRDQRAAIDFDMERYTHRGASE